MDNNKDIAASLGYKLVGEESKTEETVEQAPVENAEVKEETPIAEEAKESAESSLDNKEDNTSTEETTEEAVSSDFDSLLNERFDGKFKSYEELKEALESKPEPKQEQKYEDERLNTLLEFMNKGTDGRFSFYSTH